MPLISVRDLHLGFRGPELLTSISCDIEPGQRIGLLGRNGAGKTTFMRLLHGQIEPDSGRVIRALETAVAFLPQEIPQSVQGRVLDVVRLGVHRETLDPESAWRAEQRVRQLVTQMDLPADTPFEVLSPGLQRRVLLAQALVSSPDLLLLDEPTNHLGLDAILWLEDFLSRWTGTLLFVTHDRMFLRRLATRILEIDRGRLFDWSCDYDTFLERKEDALAAEEKQNALFDKKLAEEEAWIRQGIKARRTRNEGRVRALEQMRRERHQRREQDTKTRLRIADAQRSGTLVAEVEKVSFAYSDRQIVRDFSTRIQRGDKIGILGPNGAGKTTLLRILLGQLPPQSGSVRLGTNLQIAYFDQLRQQLIEDASVQDNVGDGYETVQVGGKPRHIIGYLRDFLFTPERARTPVRFLSGGERNRVLLARLFAKPANLLVLDEPTNDLDAETVDVLESQLVDFLGTVLLVSHDRAFLNNVVASTIVFEPTGVREYVGGFDDWMRQRAPEPAAEVRVKAPLDREVRAANASRTGGSQPSAPASKRRLTFKEQQELAALPERIEQLEVEIETLHREMTDPQFYQQPGERIAQEHARLKELEQQAALAYERWEQLDVT